MLFFTIMEKFVYVLKIILEFNFFTNPSHIILMICQVMHVAETSNPADQNITTGKDDSDEKKVSVSVNIA